MVTERHNIASRILLKGVSKGPLGAGLATVDIGSADRLALQDLQIFEHSTNRPLPNCSNEKSAKDQFCHPRHPLRSRGGRQRNREHLAPATATSPTSEACHPSQLPPEQRHVHLVEVKYCELIWPLNQLEPSKQQHRDLCSHLSRASAQLTLHTILLGVGGIIYTPHTLEPLKELGLHTHTAIKLALKLHAHSVQYAYKLVSTRDALEKTSLSQLSTPRSGC
eukprot:1161448-Pelagomonas_calceolata.AAC.3